MAVHTQAPCSFKHAIKKLQCTAKSFKKLTLAQKLATVLVLGKKINGKSNLQVHFQ